MRFLQRFSIIRDLVKLASRNTDPAMEIAKASAIEAHVAANIAFDDRGPPLQKAVDHYCSAIEASVPGSSHWMEATFHAGCLLAGENSIRDLPRAVRLLEPVVSRAIGYHDAYYYLSEAYVMLKDFDRAELLLNAALELNPSHQGIRDVLRHIPIDRVHEAAKRQDPKGVIDAVHRISPAARGAEAWVLLGDALAETDRTLAAEAWTCAMALEPLKGMRRRFRSIDIPFPGDGVSD